MQRRNGPEDHTKDSTNDVAITGTHVLTGWSVANGARAAYACDGTVLGYTGWFGQVVYNFDLLCLMVGVTTPKRPYLKAKSVSSRWFWAAGWWCWFSSLIC